MSRTAAIKHGKIPTNWTTVARERGGGWIPVQDSPFTVQEVRALYSSGMILMAQRRAKPTIDDPIPPMELLIKLR
jgi:hypothetical protein